MAHNRTASGGGIAEVSRTLELLSHAHRRGVLYALQRGGRTTVGQLADRITAWQHNDGASTTRRDVQTMLVHSHLPKLAEANVVEYDRPSDVVAPGAEFDHLVDSLRRVVEREPAFPVASESASAESASEPSR